MRLIDGDAFKTWIDEYVSVFKKSDKAEIKGYISHQPTIDIVRCKECKWADWYKTADGEQFCYCMETGNGGRTADDFCSYGEREGE